MIYIGKENTAIENDMRDKLIPLKVNFDSQGKINNLPNVREGHSIICKFNKFGLEGYAEIYICKTLEDIQELRTKYDNGFALKINWYEAPLCALNLITVSSLPQSSLFKSVTTSNNNYDISDTQESGASLSK